jgi:hypothetical protein
MSECRRMKAERVRRTLPASRVRSRGDNQPAPLLFKEGSPPGGGLVICMLEMLPDEREYSLWILKYLFVFDAQDFQAGQRKEMETVIVAPRAPASSLSCAAPSSSMTKLSEGQRR